MIPDPYVWLAWSGCFLLCWLGLFLALPGCRAAMWWSSLLALPFAFSEPLFLRRYWNPPTLFDLAQRTSVDVEAFLFCFAIGGVAAALAHVAAGRRAPERPARLRSGGTFWGGVAVAVPAVPFFLILLCAQRPIWAGVAGLSAGAVARWVACPELRARSCRGGVLFLAYYVGMLFALQGLAPGYLGRVWNPHGPAGLLVAGLPLPELLFALAFGLYWAGLYEQLSWTMGWPPAPETA